MCSLNPNVDNDEKNRTCLPNVAPSRRGATANRNSRNPCFIFVCFIPLDGIAPRQGFCFPIGSIGCLGIYERCW